MNSSPGPCVFAIRGRAARIRTCSAMASRTTEIRVGLWRMFETMDRYGIRCTVSLNLANFEHYPEIFEACERRSWDYMCHGIYNTQYLWGYGEEEESAPTFPIVSTLSGALPGGVYEVGFRPRVAYSKHAGSRGGGGISLYCDFYHDDQPIPVRVKSGSLITIPYQMDLNDAVLSQGSGEGEDFLRISRDMFDTLYAEGETTAA